MIKALKWVYVLEEDYRIDKVTIPPPADCISGCEFFDWQGNKWLVIDETGQARILKGYAWDGCTPKFKFWDLILGTPDGIPHEETKRPKTYHASLVHDTLYQFLSCLPLKRRDADKAFLEYMKEYNFAPRYVYYLAVRCFGWIVRLYRKVRRKHNKGTVKNLGK